MAKTKAELLKEAKSLGLELTEKQTVAEITKAIAAKNEAGEAIEEPKAEKATAKAGKRSAKGIEEAEAKAEKIESQKHRSEDKAAEDAKPKQVAKPTRTRLERRGKKFQESAKLIDKSKQYSLKEAVELAQKTSSVKFDASVELHVNLNVDPRQADQNIRTNLVLPAGTGKTVRVAVFADDEVKGADLSGVDKIVAELEKGIINFDTLIATPANMPKLGKYARLLGPRGLMPNPKSGTVTTDLDKAVNEAKAGRVEYRVDSTGIVHVAIGKVSFGTDKLLDNAEAVMKSIKAAKPSTVKGVYIKAVHMATSMGPGIAVNPSE